MGETYGEHLSSSMGFAAALAIAAMACAIHGIAPFLFQKTGSRAVADLHQRMVTGRHRRPDAGAQMGAQAGWDYSI